MRNARGDLPGREGMLSPAWWRSAEDSARSNEHAKHLRVQGRVWQRDEVEERHLLADAAESANVCRPQPRLPRVHGDWVLEIAWHRIAEHAPRELQTLASAARVWIPMRVWPRVSPSYRKRHWRSFGWTYIASSCDRHFTFRFSLRIDDLERDARADLKTEPQSIFG